MRRIIIVLLAGILGIIYIFFPSTIREIYTKSNIEAWNQIEACKTQDDIEKYFGKPTKLATVKGMQSWNKDYWWGRNYLIVHYSDLYGKNPIGYEILMSVDYMIWNKDYKLVYFDLKK